VSSVDDDKERRWGRLVVWGPFIPIGDTDLDRVEQAVGWALPEAYRAFTKVAHGGTLQYAARLPPGDPNGDFVELSEMLTVTGDGWGSLVGEWASHPTTYMAEQLPAGLLPVITGTMAQEICEDAKEGAEPGWLPSVVHWLDAGRPGWRWSAWAADG
jgi:hypothetical protein